MTKTTKNLAKAIARLERLVAGKEFIPENERGRVLRAVQEIAAAFAQARLEKTGGKFYSHPEWGMAVVGSDGAAWAFLPMGTLLPFAREGFPLPPGGTKFVCINIFAPLAYFEAALLLPSLARALRVSPEVLVWGVGPDGKFGSLDAAPFVRAVLAPVESAKGSVGRAFQGERVVNLELARFLREAWRGFCGGGDAR